MADIDLERKQSVSWIWWVLGLLLVGIVAFLLADALADDDDVAVAPQDEVVAPIATEPMPPAGAADQPMAVQRYMETCAERQPQEMGLDHQYTSNCVQELVGALEGIAPQAEPAQTELRPELEQARTSANELRESEQDVARHSEMTRNAFTSVAAVFEEMQSAQFPALDQQVQQLNDAAEGVTAGEDLLSQREAVQDFFFRAGELLQQMSMQPNATI